MSTSLDVRPDLSRGVYSQFTIEDIVAEQERRRILAQRQLLLDRIRFTIPSVFSPFFTLARYKGAYGGRGSAKSWSFARMLILRALESTGLRVVCAREVQKSLSQSVKLLLEDTIQEFDVGSEFRVMNNVIVTPGDGIIIFHGLQDHTAESIKSLEGYQICWVEEAQAMSQRSLDLLRPTFRRNDSELWFTWNPEKATDPIDRLLRSENTPPNAVVVRANYSDNPYLPQVLRDELEWDKRRDPEKYAHIWLGEYQRYSESRVFKNWKIEPFDAPADAMFLYGGDWGYSIDPSVLIRCYVQGRQLFIDYEAYRIGVEIDHLPDLFDTVPGSRAWTITADSARPETISYLQRHGFPKLMAAVKGKDSVKEGIIFLQNFDIVIHPRCIHTIDEFTLYSFKVDKLTNLVTPVLEDKKNHVIDSCRYAVERLRRGFDWQTVGMTSEATW